VFLLLRRIRFVHLSLSPATCSLSPHLDPAMVLFRRSKKASCPATEEEAPKSSPSSTSQRRLSKPKVNAFANPAATSSKYTVDTVLDGYDGVNESPTADIRTRQATRQALRSQLCGLEDPESPRDVHKSESLVDLAGGATNKLSRSASQNTNYLSAKGSVTQLKDSSQTSLIPETKPIDLEAAVAILQELRKTASPDDLIALRTFVAQNIGLSANIAIDKALLPTSSTSSALPPTDGSVPYSPAAVIRQRSLATPGVATRPPDLEDEKKDVLPHEVKLADEHKWRSPKWSRFAQATRLSTVESVDEESIATRAATPGVLDYAHLGAHKHGSLMVMNGPASPDPSIKSKSLLTPKVSIPKLHREEYFTASEGEDPQSAIDEIEELDPPLSPSNLTRNDFNNLPTQRDRAGRTPQPFSGPIAPAAVRSSSPLKREVIQEVEEVDFLRTSQSSSNYLCQTSPDHSSLITTPIRDHGDHSITDPYKVSPVGSYRSAASVAASLAGAYIADLPPSPYASAIDLSQLGAAKPDERAFGLGSLQPDEGYYDASPEFEDLRGYQHDDLGERQSFEPEITPEMALGSHPPVQEDEPPMSVVKHIRPIQQQKSDSGYDSSYSGYDSLRSSTRSNLQNPPITSITAPKIRPQFQGRAQSSPEGSTSIYTIRAMLAQSGPEDALRSMQSSALSQRLPDPPMESDRSKSWKKSMRKSLPRMLTGETAVSSGSSIDITSSKESKVTPKQKDKPKKLQKKRPQSYQSPAASFQNLSQDGEWPQVPSDLSARLLVRAVTSPDKEHLEQTVEDVSGSNSRMDSAGPRVDNFSNTLTFQDMQAASRLADDRPPPTPPHRFGIPHPTVSRPKGVYEDEEIVTGLPNFGLNDFGSVAQSIGRSPYDVAMAGVYRPPLQAAPTRPYQMSPLTGQFGPRQGWDDETAIRMAQMRSRERAAAQEMRMNGRPSMPPRPQSFQENASFAGRGRIPSNGSDRSSRRPRSLYGDAPTTTLGLDLPMIPPRERSLNPRSRSVPRDSIYDGPVEVPVYLEREDMAPPGGGSGRVAALAQTFDRADDARAPMPPPSQSLNWAEQASVWRQRKLHAQTTVSTSATTTPAARTTTTTTTTVVSAAPHPAARAPPWLPPAQAQPYALLTAPPAGIAPPRQRSPLPPLPPADSSDDADRRRSDVSIPEVAAFKDEGVFGRYGGGFHPGHVGRKYMGAAGTRDVSGATGGLRAWGVDLGDVPSAVVGRVGGC